MELRGALPDPLRIWWIFSAPAAIPFGIRIGWEKTVWTWTRGPQSVGFSLMHIHPGLAGVGLLGCLSLMAWLLFAIPYLIVRREIINLIDLGMSVATVVIVVMLVVPDNFFA